MLALSDGVGKYKGCTAVGMDDLDMVAQHSWEAVVAYLRVHFLNSLVSSALPG